MNRTEIRENTFKLLFCKEFHSKEEMGEQYKLYMESLEDEEREKTNKIISEDSVEELIPFEDKEYIVERVNKIIDAIPEIDKAIDEYYEMAMDDEVPGKVAVDQAVILAKKYGSDNAPAFINGILAKLFQE